MRRIAVLTSLALVVGLSAGSPTASANPDRSGGASTSESSAVASTDPTDKIVPELRATLRSDEATDFWLSFDRQPDLDAAQDILDWTERGQYVYDQLAETAENSLAAVAPELDAAGVDYESFPIANLVLVRAGTEDLALDLAANTDVIEIHETPDIGLVQPLPTTTVAAAGDSDVEWGLEFIHAPEAWQQGATGAGITVSNIDSGVQFDHPALVGSYRGTNDDGTFDHDYNWFSTRSGCDDVPCDDNGHGTHTMGTMVGADGAGNQIGVAPEAEWIATDGCCEDTGFETLLESGWWILAPTDRNGENPDVSKRPHIVNNSWGTTLERAYSDFYTPINDAWTAAGIFSVWAAGNTSPGAACNTVSSPGSHPNAYSVGAFGSTGALGAFSRKGEGEDGVIKPEISAPGVSVRSAWPGDGYHTISGTSMAAPHVAGAVAALWSYDPTLIGQIDTTQDLLAESAVDVDDTQCGGTAEFNNKYGEGRLDLARLLQLAPREGGTLNGVVASDGDPVAGAEVTIDGPFSRTVGTAEDGTFTVHLPAGDYDIAASAFGFVTGTAQATVAAGEEATVDVTLTVAPRHTVTGTVVTDEQEPIPNAAVTIADTPLPSVTTAADGTFTISDVPSGDYTLDVVPNSCFSPTTLALNVPDALSVTVPVGLVVDEWGYTCAVSEGEFRAGTEEVEFTSSSVWSQVDLPFPVALYNTSHDTLNIGKRGVVAVESQTSGPGSGGAAIFPFFTQSPLRLDHGGIYTAETTVDGEDAFVIEYRDAVIWGGTNYPREAEEPISFSATITRSGTVIFAYGDGVGGEDPLTAGLVSVTGIQGWAGQDGIRFSENAAVLHEGMVVTYEMPDFGYADITVLDANDALPIAGASVAIAGADGLVENVTTGADGSFRRQLHTGEYTAAVTAPNYVTSSYDFSVSELYDTVEVTASLATGVADLAPEGLDALLGSDQEGTGSLTLTNTGSAPATFTLSEVARHPELDTGTVETRTLKGDERTLDLTAWNEAAQAADYTESVAEADAESRSEPVGDDQIGTHAGGNVLARFATDGTSATGLGYDGDVWVHDYDERINTAYTVTGEKTGKEFAAEWNPDYRAFDLTFDSLTGDMCQMEDSPASYIHCFDRETGEKTREIQGAWSNTQLTGLTYNANLDVFYVGGRGIGAIGTVAGTSHETPGEFLSFCEPPLPEVMGLAYNPSSDTIWYSDRASNRPTRLLQVDPVDCSLVHAWWFPGEQPLQGGGLATDATGALWAVDQLTDEVLLVDVDDDLTTDLPWLSLSQTDGTLAPGESVTVEVTYSTEDQDPGVLGANILVTSDTGRQSKAYVPVTVTTTPYQVAVNAGGAAETDGSGFTWAEDQPYVEGSWGHHGRSRTISTTSDVLDTDDDALFQHQRTAIRTDLEYAFDDAPEGRYLIELGFAEIAQVEPGRRVFDVLVNDEVVEYAYDAAATVGFDTADVRTAVIEHSGGPLTVDARGAQGLRGPSLATLRVTLDPGEAQSTPPGPTPPEPGEVPVAPAGRGYTLTETTGLYRQGTTNTGWTGGCGVLWFEFDFPFYDTSWDGVCVASNGMLTFDRSRTRPANTDLPTPDAADSIYPFWDELDVDDEAGIYVGVTEIDGLRAQIIDYRNLAFRSDPSQRVSFSVTLVEDGRIQIGYGPGVGGEHPLTKGSSATIGIQSLDGNPLERYSYNEPVLTPGLGLEYVLPQSGTIEGEVIDANDGEPVDSAVVALTAEADDSTRTVITDEFGRWKAQALLGNHTVEVSSPNYVATSDTVTVTEKGQAAHSDAELPTGIAAIEGELDWLLGPDGTASAELTVTNTGSAPLSIELTEQDGNGEPVDLTWLALSGEAASSPVELAVGDVTTVTATVDNAGAEPGILTGHVLASATAGRTPAQQIPVQMATSAYWLGVDAGGQGHTDAADFEWSADQALDPSSTAGAWGYVGGSTRSTDADIVDTEEDAIFRTQRSGRSFSYVFEDAPSGTYRVELGFAELENVQPGARIFDVLVGGQVALYQHDVQAEVGGLTADIHSVAIEHAGGDLVVELFGERRQRDQILNTLKLQEDPRL